MSRIAELAAELSKLGREATTDETGVWLRVPSAPALRTPEIRGERYVWGGYSAKSAATMAKRIDSFLGKKPRDSRADFLGYLEKQEKEEGT